MDAGLARSALRAGAVARSDGPYEFRGCAKREVTVGVRAREAIRPTTIAIEEVLEPN